MRCPTRPLQNWSPDDGVPPLPGGWCDAFVHLHGASGEQEGLTYDARANPMLKKGNRLRRRLDRIFCKLRRWQLEGLEMVGRQALPGLQWEGRPVLPSDHFGLLLRLRSAGWHAQQAAAGRQACTPATAHSCSSTPPS